MDSKRLGMFFMGVCLLFAFGCRSDDAGDGDGGDGKGNGNGSGDGDGGVDFDSDGQIDNVCHDEPINLSSVATRVMLLEDRSLSMEDDNKWDLAVNAIENMVDAFDTGIEFGLDLFTDPASNDICGVGQTVLIDSAIGNGEPIVGALNRTQPGNATPLFLAMDNYLQPDYAPIFMDGGAERYLVIVSDGADTCGPEGVFEQNGRSGASPAELGEKSAALLSEQGIRTIVIGFGDGAEPDQLNAVASEGGTAFTEYLDAADGDELASVLNQIAETVVVSCQYALTNVGSDADLNLANVYFDGVGIPRDEGCASGDGWSWVDGADATIEFCDAQCALIEANEVSDISIKIMCSEADVI